VTFDLDRDLEHTLDAGPCGDHHVQLWWRSSHFCGRSNNLRKKSLQTDGQTDRQTDRQTDGRRTPRDCISSWNELKKCGLSYYKFKIIPAVCLSATLVHHVNLISFQFCFFFQILLSSVVELVASVRMVDCPALHDAFIEMTYTGIYMICSFTDKM